MKRYRTCWFYFREVAVNNTHTKKLSPGQLEPTTPNMLQLIATRWPNARNILRPTMLRYVTLACCDRLAGPLGCHARGMRSRKRKQYDTRNACNETENRSQEIIIGNCDSFR